MPQKSPLPWEPLYKSIPSFLFGSPRAALPSTAAIIDPKKPETRFFTLHTLREWSQRFAAGLVHAGLEPGDRVTLFSGNDLFTTVVVLGTMMASGIYNSANPAYTPRELAHQLKDCGPKFVLAAENCLDRALEGADLAGIGRGRVYLFEALPLGPEDGETEKHVSGRHWRSLIASPALARDFQWEELDGPEQSDRTAVLVYSSGTTGLPKGVELSHFNLVSNARQLLPLQFTTDPAQRRIVCCLPMYHGLGLVYYVIVAPKAGVQVYLMDRYALPDLLHYIQQFQITELLLVPPILVAMSKHPGVQEGRVKLDSVRKVVAGAAPIGMEISQEFERIWSGRVKVRQAWGMSEALCITMCWHESDPSTETSTSVGKLLPGGEATVLDGKGRETKPGERGELWIRGPNVMKGYWKNATATADTLTPDRWLRTGDIAYVDGEGKYYIVDRIKELIKVRGAQVAPAELEALLLEHPLILDAAVIGAKGSGDDEYPRAYVVRRPGGAVTESEIEQFVSTRVSKVKRLTGGVVFIDSVPKNPSGKILRRQLRTRAEQELGYGKERAGKL